jgi:hypothetical protein
MKWYTETTKWPDGLANGTYLLNDSKTKMFAYVRPGGSESKQFKNAINIETRGRTFAVSTQQFKVSVKAEVTEGRVIEVKGSKGDVYQVTELNGNYSCTCSGFRFRGDCKHVKSQAN